MIKAADLKNGSIVAVDGNPHIVSNLEVKTPSARGAATLYKFRLKNLVTGQTIVQSVKGDISYEEIECEKCTLQFLYSDPETTTFMDVESYEQYTVNNEDIEDELLFIKEGMENLTGLTSDEKLLTIQLPSTVVLTISECPPSMKSASATARTKPATLETGLVVNVPEFVNQDENIVVNTETRQYVSKA